MKFLFTAFAKGLGAIFSALAIWAKSTPNKTDDIVVELAESIGDKFFPGIFENDAWLGDPLTNIRDKGTAVRGIAAIMVKEMLLDDDFQRSVGMTEIQAGHFLVGVIGYLKPDAVDTPEEIEALLKAAASTETRGSRI